MTETPAPYGSVPQPDFASQYARLCAAAECRTQRELATLLEVRPASITDAKRRQFLPAEWLETLFEKKQINPRWIRTGMGGKRIQATGAATEQIVYTALLERRTVEGCTLKDCTVENCTTDELFAEIIRRATRLMP